ncbi:MAG: hypothetical protein FJX67_13390 [Alphaproteobacteria bacterium]|nr:hypothetical protein [Alphaproteobacteria bacterium]
MNALKSIKVLGIAATAIGLSWGAANAAITNLSILNPSFEHSVIGAAGGATSGAPTNWLGADQIGAFQPVTPGGSYNVPIPAGVQVGYIHEAGNLHQITGHQLVAGGTYALEVRVGDRTETSIGLYRIQILLEDPGNPGLAGATLLSSSPTNDILPGDGDFANASVNYIAPGALGGLAGRNLVVILQHTAGAGLSQVNVDAATLSEETRDAPRSGR